MGRPHPIIKDCRNDFYREIGRRIKDERNRVGMTQTQLAQLLSISRSSIANFERGAHHPSLWQVQVMHNQGMVIF